MAAVLEIFSIKNYYSSLRPGINVLVFTGSVAAVAAALLGWQLSTQDNTMGSMLEVHQWSGSITALLSLVTAVLLYRVIKNRQVDLVKFYRATLFSSVLSVTIAGHFGASLTHGDDYLSSTFPWSEDYQPKNDFNLTALSTDSLLSAAQQREIFIQVKTIFAHNCYKCHSSKKVKGELQLDQKHTAMKGGEDGPVIIPGKPDKSEIIRRVMLPPADEDAMPSKGKTLQKNEIELLRYWISIGAPWPDSSAQTNEYRVAKLEPRNPSLPVTTIADLQNPIDLWTNEYFNKEKIEWPQAVDDRIFLRRIYLDIIGLLPLAEEQEKFVGDQRTDKRSIWIKQLLSRNDDYALHWLTFWNDALRNDYTGTGYITNGRYNITDWLFKSLQTNKPYNQFVKELISPDKTSKGFIEGIQWRGVVNASQTTPMQAAQNVSQVFLGLNLKCASCHNSFISDWKLEEAYAFANIFSDSALEINRCDKPIGKFARTKILWEQLGSIDSTANRTEKLKQLATHLTKPANGRLYRTLVNRVWAQLLGRGLVEPVDAMDNEPWSQDLLDWTTTYFTEHTYDIKELIYLIASSKTYQLPSVGVRDANDIITNHYKFNGRIRKRISAEQFSDAVSSILTPVFPDSLVVYDPFGKLTETKKSFARASLVANNPFLTALGRPNREVVSTGRDSQANLLQALELTNGEKFTSVVAMGATRWKHNYASSNLLVKEFFKKALGREPSEKELKVAIKIVGEIPNCESIEDLFWSVLLLPEFQIVY
jgi:mono/diheme cytochrome c family protein